MARDCRCAEAQSKFANRANIIAEEIIDTLEGERYSLAEYQNLIEDMFENPNFDTSKHLRDKYNLGEAPEWMRKIGMIGKEFSLSFKNIKIHKGKDNDHALTKDEWLKLPQAIKKPFAITR